MAGFTYYEGSNWEDNKAPAISALNLIKMENGIKNALPMTGGQMTGDLILGDVAYQAMSAIPKTYADTNIMYIHENYNQKGTYTKKIEGFDASKYLPLVFYWSGSIGASNYLKIVEYGERTSYYSSGSNASYVTIGSDGGVKIEATQTNSTHYPLIAIFLPAKKI